MKLIVGLGNPGDKYAHTRHNIGFDVIDRVCDKLSLASPKSNFQGEIYEKNIDGEKVFFLKPTTFMNLSGNSVTAVVNFYKINPKTDVLVVYDDMDLPVGKLRVRYKGSAGGHNGMKSIIAGIGDEFLRIRVGIGKNQDDVIDFVLGKFLPNDREIIASAIDAAANAAIDFAGGDTHEAVMQKYNKAK